MNEWGLKIRVFLAALLGSFTGILPLAGCSGSCGACLQCAGLGGVMAVFAAMGVARNRKRGGGTMERLNRMAADR